MATIRQAFAALETLKGKREHLWNLADREMEFAGRDSLRNKGSQRHLSAADTYTCRGNQLRRAHDRLEARIYATRLGNNGGNDTLATVRTVCARAERRGM